MRPSRADRIWNRACSQAGREPDGALRDGDRALAAMVMADSLVPNGGVLDAAENLEPGELEAACAGFEWFGLTQPAEILRRAASAIADGDKDALDKLEEKLDKAYCKVVSNERGTLEAAFRKDLAERPHAYAPVDDTDVV